MTEAKARRPKARRAKAPPAPVVQVIERKGLRLKSVAQRLDVSASTIEKWRDAGTFPAPDVRVGKIMIWDVATVDAWFDARKTKGA